MSKRLFKRTLLIACLQLFKASDTYHVRIKWDGNREEQLTLTCVDMQ